MREAGRGSAGVGMTCDKAQVTTAAGMGLMSSERAHTLVSNNKLGAYTGRVSGSFGSL